MIRFIGLIVLAVSFIGIVVDGTRSMANSSLLFTSIATFSDTLFPSLVGELQNKIITGATPWLWTEVCVYLLPLPVAVVGFVAGALLLKLGQKRTPPPTLLDAQHPN